MPGRAHRFYNLKYSSTSDSVYTRYDVALQLFLEPLQLIKYETSDQVSC